MTASESVCLLVNVSFRANSVDPDQTAPTGNPTGSTLFVEEVSKTFQQMTRADNLCCIGFTFTNVIRSRFS